jgi:hypothetical protein
VHEGARERELLLHPTGERPGTPVAEALDLCVDGRDQRPSLLEGRSEHRGEEAEVLLDREIGIEGEPPRHVPNAGANCPEVAHHVEAEDLGRTTVGKEEGGEDAEKGRLPRTVGADEPEQLATIDLERDTVERAHRPERAYEIADDDGVAHEPSPLAGRSTSAGMPILSAPSGLGTTILTA